MKSSAGVYAVGAGVCACTGAAALAPFAPEPGWLLAGAAAMAAPAVAAGAALAREHGRPGPRFVVIFGAGVASRFALGAAAAVASAAAGPAARASALAGLALGFVLPTAFEMAWFARRTAVRSAGAGGRG